MTTKLHSKIKWRYYHTKHEQDNGILFSVSLSNTSGANRIELHIGLHEFWITRFKSTK